MTNARQNSQHGHVFRPSVVHRRRAYWLDGAVLHWEKGGEKGHVSLSDVTALHVWMPPPGPVRHAHCIVFERSGRRHTITDRYWFAFDARDRRRWGQAQHRPETFAGLVVTLARRLEKANPDARLMTGPGYGPWVACCVLAALMIALACGAAAVMIARREFSWSAAALIGFGLVQLPLLWPTIRSGGLTPLDPNTLHDARPASGWVDW